MVKIRVNHRSSIPGARWCEPVGWEPANSIDGAEWWNGSWWDDTEEVAGLVFFETGRIEAEEGEIIDAPLDEIRVSSCGNCRVIGEVKMFQSNEEG